MRHANLLGGYFVSAYEESNRDQPAVQRITPWLVIFYRLTRRRGLLLHPVQQ